MTTSGTISHTVILVSVECCQCSMPFAITEDFKRRRLDDHATWYCPNGHGNVYFGKSDREKAVERAERLAQQLASREEDLRAERMSHAATKGTLTKVRNRADKGVCQHCKRSFANVQRHVAHMHPDVSA